MIGLKYATSGLNSQKNIALTFDDGPNPYATPKILDILDSFQVKGSFFVIGKRCLQYPSLLKEIKRRGHLIGGHTFSHAQGDFLEGNQVIKKILGQESGWFRPPYLDFSFCNSEREYLSKKLIVGGDLSPRDFLPLSAAEVAENTLKAARAGSIFIFHDSSEVDLELEYRAEKTIEALPRIILELRRMGYQTKPLADFDLQFQDF